MPNEERKWLEAAQRGENEALEKILAQYEPKIFRFGLRMCGNEEEAKEVLQETLLAAFRGLRGFRGDASLSTWLYQIARSFCIKERRGMPREEIALDSPVAKNLAADAQAPDMRAHAKQVSQTIQAAIGSLSTQDREVILLRDVEGLSAEEASEVIGIEVRALKSRLHRARMRLRQKLAAFFNANEEGTSSAPCPELAEELSAYSSNEIDQAACVQIEAHLARCPKCSGTCEELKKSVSLCRALPEGEVPAPIRASVRKALAGAGMSVP